MSRLSYDIEANEARISNIEDAIEHVEMVRDLGTDGAHVIAMSVAIDCMKGERTRLLSHVSKLKALQESPVKDAVSDAIRRQRADQSGYDVVADAASTVEAYEVRF